MRVLHISDLHIVPGTGEHIYGVDSYASLERVLESARSLAPDLIVATGDLAEGGDAPSYRRLRRLLRSTGVPVLVLPGNHDSLRRMSSELCDDLISFPRIYESGGWRFVLLNSQVRGEAYGELTEETLLELESVLGEAEHRPTLVALHHSPIAPCQSLGCQLVGAASFLEQLSRHSNVKAVIAGHSHIDAEASFRGIRVATTPSTCAEAWHAPASSCTDLEDFWASHSFNQSRHGYRVLDLGSDGSLTSEVHWVANPAAA